MKPRYEHEYAHEDRFLGYFQVWDLWLQINDEPLYFYALNGTVRHTVPATAEGVASYPNLPCHEAFLHALAILTDPSVSPSSRPPGIKVKGNAQIPF